MPSTPHVFANVSDDEIEVLRGIVPWEVKVAASSTWQIETEEAEQRERDAAPDMLDALRDMERRFFRPNGFAWDDTKIGREYGTDFILVARRVRAAIAKAQGGE